MRTAITLAMALLVPTAALAEDPLFDAVTGYRLTHYRGVIAVAPEGVSRIDVSQAKALWRRGAIFVDVNPAPGAVRDALTSRWTLAEFHSSIPGAYWFPETGRGMLAPEIESRFILGIRRLALHNPRRPLVIFCQADCWMSWNAALRLHRAGIRNIVWFADGLDGWKEASLPVKTASPL